MSDVIVMHLCDLVIYYDNPMGEGFSHMVYPLRLSTFRMITFEARANEMHGAGLVYNIIWEFVRGRERNGFVFYKDKSELLIPSWRIRAILVGPQLVSDDEVRLKMAQGSKYCIHCKAEVVWEGRTRTCKGCGRTYYVPTSEELEAGWTR